MRLLPLLVAFIFSGLFTEAAHKDILARSDFHWGEDGWASFGPGKTDLYARAGVLYGSDKGKKVWYFKAPESFLGDKCFAHNGELSFRLGHSEYMSNGKDMIRDWDVILESKLWKLRFGIKNLIPPWVGSTKQVVSLNENAWTNIASGHAPTTIEMLRMLTAISGLFIRGGYYDGHEETWIDEIQISEGDHKQDVMLRRIEKHATHPSTIKPKEPEPVVDEDANLDHEELIARELARKAIEKKEAEARQKREEEERKAEEERIRKEEEERAKAKFAADASLKEQEIAKVLSQEHEAKTEKEADLTAEEIAFAVDAAEKEMLKKMREKQIELERKDAQRREMESEAQRRQAAKRAEEEKARQKAHEEHLSRHEKSPSDVHSKEEHDLHVLHSKAHSASQRRQQEQAKQHTSSDPSSIPPATEPQTKHDALQEDISVEEAARIASETSSTLNPQEQPETSVPPPSEVSPPSEKKEAEATPSTEGSTSSQDEKVSPSEISSSEDPKSQNEVSPPPPAAAPTAPPPSLLETKTVIEEINESSNKKTNVSSPASSKSKKNKTTTAPSSQDTIADTEVASESSVVKPVRTKPVSP